MNNPFIDPSTSFHSFTKSENNQELVKQFFKLDIKEYSQALKTKPESFWINTGEKKALNLFHLAAKYVPAYQDFLKKNKVKPQSIKNIDDFNQVPPTDKLNYISQYSLSDLSWSGYVNSSNIISYSSGATGQPYLWPRGLYQDLEGAFQFEHLLTSLFQIDQRSTLLVNCFSMGNYVAGVYVSSSCKLVAQKSHPLTIVSPGINDKDALDMLQRVDHQYDQIIIAGYPPFIRNLIDTCLQANYRLPSKKLKFFFASEFFSESWRKHTLSLTGKRNPVTDSTNIYGTADTAIFSFETPTTILLRQLSQSRPQLNQSLFNTNLTPTFVQYNPALTYYEHINNNISVTCAAGIPLIRYDLKDQGGILLGNQVNQSLEENGLYLNQELAKHNLTSNHNNLPYLFVTNRADNAVSFYAITIYPEYIRNGIESTQLTSQLSGRFTLISNHQGKDNPTLDVHVELNPNIKPSQMLETIVCRSVTKSLKKHCSEYSFLEQSIGNLAKPNIILHTNGDNKYFKIGIKQKWIIK